MEYEIITDPAKIDRKEWSDFVNNHPDGNIFQTPEIYTVYEKTEKYEPIILIVKDKNRIVGILLSVIQKENSGFLGIFSARSIVWGGPLIKNNDVEVLDLVLKEYDVNIRKKSIYTQFRNFWDWKNLDIIFKNSGFKYEEHLNILINLEKKEEQLWRDVHSKRRNEIRRAKKEGAVFSVETTIESLTECFNIIKEVYSFAKLPYPSFNFFKKLFENSQKRIGLKIFTAKYKNEIIGCMLALVFKDTIYDFYAGSYRKYYKKYPNDLIPWEVFLWGKENGYKNFDFGGAGKPGVPYGVRDYKKKFGGEFVNFGRFEKIHKPIIYRFAKTGFKLWRIIKK